MEFEELMDQLLDRDPVVDPSNLRGIERDQDVEVGGGREDRRREDNDASEVLSGKSILF